METLSDEVIMCAIKYTAQLRLALYIRGAIKKYVTPDDKSRSTENFETKIFLSRRNNSKTVSPRNRPRSV